MDERSELPLLIAAVLMTFAMISQIIDNNLFDGFLSSIEMFDAHFYIATNFGALSVIIVFIELSCVYKGRRPQNS